VVTSKPVRSTGRWVDMSFWLRDLPTVMRNQGWRTGAACMERWFNTPARIMSLSEKNGRIDYTTLRAGAVDTDLVKMAWAMRFARLSEAAIRLQREWVTQRASDLLRVRVARWRSDRGIRKDASFRFGDLSMAAPLAHKTCQANSRPVGGLLDPFDDFYAALGRATLNVAVTGMVEIYGGRTRLRVDGLGLYLRDSYEFLGEQSLGYWNSQGVASFAADAEDIPTTSTAATQSDDYSIGLGRVSMSFRRQYRVTNGSFASFRSTHKRGGDFSIFSDLYRPTMPHPVNLWL
jgi:hypothetical protein